MTWELPQKGPNHLSMQKSILNPDCLDRLARFLARPCPTQVLAPFEAHLMFKIGGRAKNRRLGTPNGAAPWRNVRAEQAPEPPCSKPDRQWNVRKPNTQPCSSFAHFKYWQGTPALVRKEQASFTFLVKCEQ